MTRQPASASTGCTSSRASGSSSTTSTRTPASSGNVSRTSSGAAAVRGSRRPSAPARADAPRRSHPGRRRRSRHRSRPWCRCTRWRTMARPRPRPPKRARGGAVRLTEAVEDVGQQLGRDAAPRVPHEDFARRGRARAQLSDRSARGRELDGVRQQVPDDLLQTRGRPTTGRLRDRHVQRDLPPLAATGATVSRAAPTTAARVHRPHVQLQLAGHDAGDVEQVVDQLRLRRVLRSTNSSPRASRRGSSRPPRIRRVQPSIAFSGVRSSCERVAMKSSLSRFARSASVRAARSASYSRSRSAVEASVRVRCGGGRTRRGTPARRRQSRPPGSGWAPRCRRLAARPVAAISTVWLARPTTAPCCSTRATGFSAGRECFMHDSRTLGAGAASAPWGTPAGQALGATGFMNVTQPRTSVAMTASPMLSSVVSSHSRCSATARSAAPFLLYVVEHDHDADACPLFVAIGAALSSIGRSRPSRGDEQGVIGESAPPARSAGPSGRGSRVGTESSRSRPGTLLRSPPVRVVSGGTR